MDSSVLVSVGWFEYGKEDAPTSFLDRNGIDSLSSAFCYSRTFLRTERVLRSYFTHKYKCCLRI